MTRELSERSGSGFAGKLSTPGLMLTVVLGLAGLLAGCATPPMQRERVASYAIDVSEGSKVAQFVETARVAAPGPSGFHLLGDGLDAFVARVVTARAAEQTIDLQYYLYHNDLTGRLLGAELLAAADRGVRVRMLVDDMGLQGRDRGAVALDRHENIEVRIINPFHRGRSRVGQMIGRLGTVTRRMHNKSFVVDNQVAILGGRNIGDEYFAADPALDFSDLDVMAIGEVVAETSAAFDLYWNHALSYPVDALISEPVTDAEVQQMRDDLAEYVASQQASVYLQALRSSRLAQEFRANRVAFVGGQGEVLFDHPDKLRESREREDLHLRKQIAPWMSDLSQELIIVSPYFIPGDEGVRALVALVDRGVRVRILTNGLSSTDVPIVYGAYARYRKALLDGGVELYELNQPLPDSGHEAGFKFTGSTKASLHAKTFVVDRKKVFIGSMNLDPRSLVENTEIGLMIDAPELSRGMAEGFDAEIDVKAFELTLQPDSQGKPALRWQGIVDGEMKTLSSSPYTTAWQRFLAKMMGWLPVESQL